MASVKRFPRLKPFPLSSTEKRLAKSEIVQAIPLDSDGAGAVGQINRYNVGRIAERIVANELEARGFVVSHLNKDGVAPNADLVAISPDRTLQVQVKGATNKPKDHLWVGYGYFTDEIIEGKRPIFNGRQGFYKADIVVLVAVRFATEYTCFVLPVDIAEQAAQLHRSVFRVRGWPRGRTHVTVEPGHRAEKSDPRVAECRAIVTEELVILDRYRDKRGWMHLAHTAKANPK